MYSLPTGSEKRLADAQSKTFRTLKTNVKAFGELTPDRQSCDT